MSLAGRNGYRNAQYRAKRGPGQGTPSSVLPALHIRALRGRLLHALHYGRKHTLVVIGDAGIAFINVLSGVAVRLARTVEESCGGGRVGAWVVHPILREVDGVIQIPSIHVADGEVQLAGELGTERLPVALHDGGEIVVLPPV